MKSIQPWIVERLPDSLPEMMTLGIVQKRLVECGACHHRFTSIATTRNRSKECPMCGTRNTWDRYREILRSVKDESGPNEWPYDPP